MNINRQERRIEMTIVSVMALCLFVCMPFPSLAQTISEGKPLAASATIAGNISTVEVIGLYSISRAELFYLMDIKEGKPLDAITLRAGIKRAFLKGIFEDITVEAVDSNRTVIRITVIERPVIRSLAIEGNDYFSARFIKKSLSIKKGQRFSEIKLEKAVATLSEALRKKGFPDNRLKYSFAASGLNKTAISIVIEEGKPLIATEVRISGDEDGVIAKGIRIKAGGIYDQVLLDEDIDKVRTRLRSRDYLDSGISYKFNAGVLDILAIRGKKLSITFEGNKSISSASLKKEIPFIELNSFSYDLLEETVNRIVRLYHTEGYPEVQIAPVVSEQKDAISIKLFVNEGARYSIGSIRFEGVSLPAEKMKGILMLQTGEYYNPDLIASDNENLMEFYRSLGYLNVESKEPGVEMKDNKVSVLFRVNEGSQVKVDKITISGNGVISTELLQNEMPLKQGNPYNEIDIINSKIKMLDMYHRKGFLNANVTVTKDIIGTNAAVGYIVREGAESVFGKTVVIGNEDTRREVITRALLHKEDQPFNDSLLLKERQRLYRTGIFSGVDIAPGDISGINRDVLYRVEEGDAGAFEFGGGYGEYERVRGFFDISHKNILGMNRELAFRTEMSTLNRRFLLTYFEPWFLNEDLGFKVQLIKEYRKEINIDNHDTRYRLDSYAARAGIEKKLNDKIKVETYYELLQIKTYDVVPDIVLTKEDTGTLLISAIKAGLIYDSRDNPFDPRTGLLGGLTYKIATALLLSETEFHKVQMYINRYQAINKHMVIAASFRSGYAWSFDKTASLPLVERFFLGGRTTVRGYDQDMLGPKGSANNPTGGNIFMMGNIELRMHIWKGIGLVAFLDSGNVWQQTRDFSFSSIKYTTGLGIRYDTPVGPIRVDYGHKLTRGIGESRGAVHFSIGQAF